VERHLRCLSILPVALSDEAHSADFFPDKDLARRKKGEAPGLIEAMGYDLACQGFWR